MAPSRILVTGANKGIGFAVVEAILQRDPAAIVVLGARNGALGEAARDRLAPSAAARVEVVELDVTSDASVFAAANAIAAGGDQLAAIVNNAGVPDGDIPDRVLNVNFYGAIRCMDAFRPLLVPDGRIINVSSAVGPMFVAKCSDARRKCFTDSVAHSCDSIRGAAAEFLAAASASTADGGALLSALGYPAPLDGMSAYGASKAFLNAYTASLAAETSLRVNACTPGFISTDLTRRMLKDKTPEQAGALQPADGARVVLHLLYTDTPRGAYYGSDSKRSPLDKYRGPGEPEYDGGSG